MRFGARKLFEFIASGWRSFYKQSRKSRIEASWDQFVVDLSKKISSLDEMPPALAVQTLLSKVKFPDNETCRILDVGTELGKNARPFLKMKCKVTIIDISPKAIELSLKKFSNLGLSEYVEGAFATSLETTPNTLGHFDAVVGTYAFSFIKPSKFNRVMKKKVFDCLKSSGYFAGHFFGKECTFADDPSLTIHSEESLRDLLVRNGMTVVSLKEQKKTAQTVNMVSTVLHDFAVVAVKNKR